MICLSVRDFDNEPLNSVSIGFFYLFFFSGFSEFYLMSKKMP